jgi:hypothetical protein
MAAAVNPSLSRIKTEPEWGRLQPLKNIYTNLLSDSIYTGISTYLCLESYAIITIIKGFK